MKTVDFSETIEACDLKVGRYGQLIDFMKFGNLGFSVGKSENSGFFRNYCSL